MVLPVVGLSYFMVGGWEEAKGQCGSVDDDVVESDSTTLVAVHSVIFAFPVLMGLFTVISTVVVWQEGRKYKRRKQPGGPPRAPSQHKEEVESDHEELKDIEAIITEVGEQSKDQKVALIELKRKMTLRAKKTRRERIQAEREADGNSWTSWSSLSSSSSGSENVEEAEAAKEVDGAAPPAPARRAGGTGYVPTQGLRTEEELRAEDTVRQVDEMVTLGARKPPKGVQMPDTAETAETADDASARRATNRKRKKSSRRTTSTAEWLQSEGLEGLAGALSDVGTVGELLEREAGELHALVKDVEAEQRGMLKQALKHFRELDQRMTLDEKKKKATRKRKQTARKKTSRGEVGTGRRKRKASVAARSKLSEETMSRHAQRRSSLADRLAAYHKRVSNVSSASGPAITNVEAGEDGVRRLVPMGAGQAMRMAVQMRRWAKHAKDKVADGT